MRFTMKTDGDFYLYIELFGYELELEKHSCPNCDPKNYPNTPQGAIFAMLTSHGMENANGIIRCAACKETLIKEINRPVDDGDLTFLEDVHVCVAKETSESD